MILLDEWGIEKVTDASDITKTFYEINKYGFISSDELICAIDELINCYKELKRQLNDLKQDLEDNYVAITKEEQIYG